MRTERIIIWLIVVLFLGAIIFSTSYLRGTPIEPTQSVSNLSVDVSSVPAFYLGHHADTLSALAQYAASWKIHFVDVGQGDAILIQGDNKNLLIDGGDAGSGIMDYLLSLNIDTLHWVFVTHPHADHIAGLLPVFRKIPVINVADPGFNHSSALYRNYRALVDSAATVYLKAFSGWSLAFSPGYELQVIHPDTLTAYDINNVSLVLRLKMNDIYALFTGDAEGKAERAILKREASIRSHILKVGHHGSKTSSGFEFVGAVNPELAVIQCGEGNKYGFPHIETLGVLQQWGSKQLRSDQQGDILVLVNGTQYSVFYGRKDEVLLADIISVAGLEMHSRPDAVDINSADVAALIKIVHVGETTAHHIIRSRPFATVDELTRVRGIGKRKIKDIKKQGLAVALNQ